MEIEVAARLGFALEEATILVLGAFHRRVQVAVNPAKIASDVLGADVVHDLVDRGRPRVPHAARRRFAEGPDEFVAREIRDGCHVRGRVTGVDAGAALAFDQRDGLARALEQVRGRDPHDAGPDDDDIHFQRAVDRGESGQGAESIQ